MPGSSDQISPTEYARRIRLLVKRFPQCGHHFPILHWGHPNDHNDLIDRLKHAGLSPKLYSSIYYGTLAACDIDYCIEIQSNKIGQGHPMTNPNLIRYTSLVYAPEMPNITISVDIQSSSLVETNWIPFVTARPELCFDELDYEIPEEQIEIIGDLYPKSQATLSVHYNDGYDFSYVH